MQLNTFRPSPRAKESKNHTYRAEQWVVVRPRSTSQWSGRQSSSLLNMAFVARFEMELHGLRAALNSGEKPHESSGECFRIRAPMSMTEARLGGLAFFLAQTVASSLKNQRYVRRDATLNSIECYHRMLHGKVSRTSSTYWGSGDRHCKTS